MFTFTKYSTNTGDRGKPGYALEQKENKKVTGYPYLHHRWPRLTSLMPPCVSVIWTPPLTERLRMTVS